MKHIRANANYPILSDIIRYYPILTKHVLKLKRIWTAGLEKTFTKFIVIFVQQK